MSSTFIGPLPIEHDRPQRRCHGAHHGSHAVSEVDPDRIVGLDGAVALQSGAAVADDVGEVFEGLAELGQTEEVDRFGDAGVGGGIEEQSAGGGVRISIVLLGNEAQNGQIVAQNARSAHGSGAAGGELGGGGRALSEGCKQAKLDGRRQRGGALVSGHEFEHAQRWMPVP